MKRISLVFVIASFSLPACDTQPNTATATEATEATGETGETTDDTDSVGETDGTGEDGCDTEAACTGLPSCEWVTEEIPVDQENPSGYLGGDLLAHAGMFSSGVLKYDEGGETSFTLSLAADAQTMAVDYQIDDGICTHNDYAIVTLQAEATLTSADGQFTEVFPIALRGTSDEHVSARSAPVDLQAHVGTYMPPAEVVPESFSSLGVEYDFLFGFEQTYLGEQEMPYPPSNGRVDLRGELLDAGCDDLGPTEPCQGTGRWYAIGSVHFDG